MLQTIGLFRALATVEARAVGRDSMLRGMLMLPIVIGLAARFVLPTVLQRLGATFDMDLLAWSPAITSSILLLIAPLVSGTVVGFLLLDQRDERTLLALQVTPISLMSYVTYRLAMPMILSFMMTVVGFLVADATKVQLGIVSLASIVAAPLAAITALALNAFASNKVQGLALTKLAGVFLLPPLGALFVPSVWHHVLGVIPTFWAPATYRALEAGSSVAAVYIVIGLLYQSALVYLLFRGFSRSVYR
jgi:fluoroquinolone transport system permease protein